MSSHDEVWSPGRRHVIQSSVWSAQSFMIVQRIGLMIIPIACRIIVPTAGLMVPTAGLMIVSTADLTVVQTAGLMIVQTVGLMIVQVADLMTGVRAGVFATTDNKNQSCLLPRIVRINDLYHSTDSKNQ